MKPLTQPEMTVSTDSRKEGTDLNRGGGDEPSSDVSLSSPPWQCPPLRPRPSLSWEACARSMSH